MAVLASATITLSTMRDIKQVYKFYKLQSSTAAAPAKPTSISSIPPSGWSSTEPSYSSGSTNSLYITELTVFTDNTFSYTDVCLSSSYEAAKQAYNKAVTAGNTASSANSKIDNLKVGGRNLIADSKGPVTSSNYGFMDRDLADGIKLTPGETYTFTVNGHSTLSEADGNKYLVVFIYDTTWKNFNRAITIKEETDTTRSATFTFPEAAKDAVIRVTSYYFPKGTPRGGGSATVNWVKLEKGNKATDWTPAPEDVDASIEKKTAAFYQTSAPPTTDRKTGDVWFDTDDGNKMYYWNGSAWTLAQFGTNAIAKKAIKADRIDVDDLFAQTINAKGTISGMTIKASNADFSTSEGSLHINNSGIYTGSFSSQGYLVGMSLKDQRIISCGHSGMWNQAFNGASPLLYIPYQTNLGGAADSNGTGYDALATVRDHTGGGWTQGVYQGCYYMAYAGVDKISADTNGYDAYAKIYNNGNLCTTGDLWAGWFDGTREHQIGVSSKAGNLYIYSQGTSGGNVGLWAQNRGSLLTLGSNNSVTSAFTWNIATFNFQDWSGTYRRPIASATTAANQIAYMMTGSTYLSINAKWSGSSFASRKITVSSSDIRLKENVKDTEVKSALSVINKIKIHSFDWKDGGGHRKIGFVADEMELIDPYLAIGGGYTSDGQMDVKSVDTFYLEGYIVKAIQELSEELRRLKRRMR